jgi:hypothetical protein
VGNAKDSGAGLGYAGPIGLLAGKPKNQTSSEFYANQLTGGIQGLLGNPLGNREQQRIDQQHLDQEQARIAAEQHQRDQNIAQLRSIYGIGDDETAHNNQRTLADFLGSYYRDVLGANLGEADKQYATTSRQSRQNLARVGQLGSGLDASSQSGTLSDYLRARQQAVLDAAQQRDRLNANLTGQRLNFEQQIQGGNLANPDFGGIAAQKQAQLDSARSQIAPAAIGHLFTVAGEGYQQGRIQEAQGNQGLQAFGFGSSGSRGSIT